MKRLLFVLILMTVSAWAQEPPFELSPAEKSRIGQKIWQNECGGSIPGLTSWNEGEEFPSLGIGHFIWYPANFQGPFEESFPGLIQYAQNQGAHPPEVAKQRHCPWTSRSQFLADREGRQLTELRTWLADSVSLQTDFIIARSRQALAKMKSSTSPQNAERVERNYARVATTPNGVYALIDYVNFKGEGTNPKERYHGQGWGLLWVLQEMKDGPAGQAAAREFASAAQRVLDRRIANAPPERGEGRWRQGWFNRCEGYARPF